MTRLMMFATVMMAFGGCANEYGLDYTVSMSTNSSVIVDGMVHAGMEGAVCSFQEEDASGGQDYFFTDDEDTAGGSLSDVVVHDVSDRRVLASIDGALLTVRAYQREEAVNIDAQVRDAVFTPGGGVLALTTDCRLVNDRGQTSPAPRCGELVRVLDEVWLMADGTGWPVFGIRVGEPRALDALYRDASGLRVEAAGTTLTIHHADGAVVTATLPRRALDVFKLVDGIGVRVDNGRLWVVSPDGSDVRRTESVFREGTLRATPSGEQVIHQTDRATSWYTYTR